MNKPINQADVALMQYPLGIPMEHQLAVNDLLFYQARSSGPSTAGFYTGDSAYSIAWLQLGNRSAADAQFNLAFDHMDLGHYNVWKEKSFGNYGNLVITHYCPFMTAPSHHCAVTVSSL